MQAVYVSVAFIVIICVITWPSKTIEIYLVLFQNFIHKRFIKDKNALSYNVKRIGFNFMLLSNIPFLYFATLYTLQKSNSILFFVKVSLMISAYGIYKFYSYYFKLNHLIFKSIEKQDKNENAADNVAKEINSYNKVPVLSNSNTNIFFTENWLVKISTFDINVLKLDTCVLSIYNQFIQYPPTVIDFVQGYGPSYGNCQILQIRAKFNNPKFDAKKNNQRNASIPSFTFNIYSGQVDDIEILIKKQVINETSANILIPLNQEFARNLQKSLYSNNDFSNIRTDSKCVCCYTSLIDVKIRKRCRKSDCGNCNCNPTLCSKCLGFWFAKDQLSLQYNLWITGSSSCPTCKRKFCIFDLEPNN